MSSQTVRPRGRSANIFINYRREDSSGHAGRLFDALSDHFAGRLFMDVDTLEPGVDFVEAIELAVGSCEVLIVIIGREWLSIKNAAGQRRLDDPADFVRLEVESALVRKIRVIPVLVQEAPMPRAEDLPPSLARLARRNAIELSDARWAYDVDRLARTIQDILQEKEGPAPAPAAVPAPAPQIAPLLTAPAAPAVAAKGVGSRVWLVSGAAAVLVAALVLASVLWLRTPGGGEASEQGQQATLAGGVLDPMGSTPTGSPASGEPLATPASYPTSANGAPSAGNGVPTSGNDVPLAGNGVPARDEPSRNTSRVPAVTAPGRNVPAVTVPVGAEPGDPSTSLSADPRAESSASAVALQPVEATITWPRNNETVGASIEVQGILLGLGDRRAFLCIRQKDQRLYLRGELLPDAKGQWNIRLRSSKEKNFDILVVTSSTKEAGQTLNRQESRDKGLSLGDLPEGAVISSDAVAVRRQGKIPSIFNPKQPNGRR